MKLITTSPTSVYYVDLEGVRYILNKTLSGKSAINVLCEDCNLFFYRNAEKEWVEVSTNKQANNLITKPLNQAFKILKKLQRDHKELKEYKYARTN